MKIKSMTKSGIIIGGMLFFAILTAFDTPWIVPEAKAKVANPVASNPASVKAGKELYVQHCQSCHGKSGHGDGPKAATLKTEPGSFATAAAQKQTDGALFYKMSEGRGDMPSFKKKLPDAEDIWNLVNYVRTLKS